MKRGSITKFKLDPKKPPRSDWRAFDAMSEADRHRAALSDPDAQPATKAQLARARRMPSVCALRTRGYMTSRARKSVR
jgi:putative transcriptional regulator